MGVYSDAVLVMKKEVYEELQSLNTEWSKELLTLARETVHGEDQVLLEYGYLKVYYKLKGNEFYDFIQHFNEADYYLYILQTEGISEYGVHTDYVGELEPEWEFDVEVEANITY